MGNQNLSEKLFKPKFNYPETSALIQRVDLSESTFNTLLDGESDSRWYRVLNPLLWHWRCVPILELEETLARIAAVKKKQSNENWLDTVIGYQSGNWIYEFVCRAAEWQKKAEQTASLPMSEENKQKRHQEWLISSQLSSIASYPHYQSDDLASQAQIFAFRAYREALDASPYVLKRN